MNKKNPDATKLRTEIGRLHRLIDLNRDFVQESENEPKLRSKTAHVETMYRCDPQGKIIKELSTKIDQWCALQKPDTKDFTMGLILKASVMRLRSSYELNKEQRAKLIRDAFAIVEPYAKTVIGFYPYINMLILLFEMENQGEVMTVTSPWIIEKLEKALAMVIEYKRKPDILVWDFFCIYSGAPPTHECSEQSKEFFKRHLSYCLLTHYRQLDTPESEAKLQELIMPAFRFIFVTIKPCTIYQNLYAISSVIDILFDGRRFKQLDHCLAGVMFNTVKYRKSLPEYKRHEVSKIQASLSRSFYLWGSFIAVESMAHKHLWDAEYAKINNETFDEIEWFNEPGVEIYAHQFPINIVETSEEIGKIVKRCIAWYKRTKHLLKEAGEGNSENYVRDVNELIDYFNEMFPSRYINNYSEKK